MNLTPEQRAALLKMPPELAQMLLAGGTVNGPDLGNPYSGGSAGAPVGAGYADPNAPMSHHQSAPGPMGPGMQPPPQATPGGFQGQMPNMDIPAPGTGQPQFNPDMIEGIGVEPTGYRDSNALPFGVPPPPQVPGMQPPPQGVQVADEGGNIGFNQGQLSKKLSEGAGADEADLLKEAREKANGVGDLINNLTIAEEIINGGFDSGMGAGTVSFFDRIGAAIGATGGDYSAQYQALDRVAKEIGINTLTLMGGNDTERELQTAIATTVNPRNEEKVNLQVIADKMAAAEILAAKPREMITWINTFGSLNSLDPNGQNWSSHWLGYQRQNFKERRNHHMGRLGLVDVSDDALLEKYGLK